MNDQTLTDIAQYMGELVAAATHDLKSANPGDVGLHGVPIVAWREAYLEGCRDMANGVYSRIPEPKRDEIGKAMRAAYDAELASHNQTSRDER